MRKPNEDKLDEIIRNNTLKNNLVKWWNVILRNPDSGKDDTQRSVPSDEEGDVFSDGNTDLYESVLKDNHRDEDAFEKAMKGMEKDNDSLYASILKDNKRDEDAFEKAMKGMEKDNNSLYDSILKDNHRDEDAFEKAMKGMSEETAASDDAARPAGNTASDGADADALAMANDIYERLMREAQEDEAKKQREIEEARKAAEDN